MVSDGLVRFERVRLRVLGEVRLKVVVLNSLRQLEQVPLVVDIESW